MAVDIEAGWGIEAGLFINCKKTLNSGFRIFAGLCIWKKPENEDLKITCGKLVIGGVCFGELIETGLIDNEQESKKKALIAKANELLEQAKNM